MFSSVLDREFNGTIKKNTSFTALSPNPTTQEYSYDRYDRLVKEQSSNNSFKYKTFIGYNSVGDKTVISEYDDNYLPTNSSLNTFTKFTYDQFYTHRITSFVDSVFSNSQFKTARKTNIQYDPNGSTKNILRTLGWNDWNAEQYSYNYAGLVTHLLSTGSANHMIYDWSYHYSPMGGRESKRLDICNGEFIDLGESGTWTIKKSDAKEWDKSTIDRFNKVEFPWKYYLRGAGGEELAQYSGMRNDKSVTLFLDHYSIGSEYFAYSCGDKEYLITDHLGSVRVVYNEKGEVVGDNSYRAFGDTLSSVGSSKYRRWIGCERDPESSTGEHGVRKYDFKLGRFRSVDALWENYRDWSGYQYALANPVKLFDKNGKWAEDADIKSSTNTFIEEVINVDYINEFVTRAPAIADYIEKNSFKARFKKMDNDGEYDPNNNTININSIFKSKPELGSSVIIHEIVHKMGLGEYSAWAAEFAYGSISNKQMIAMYQDTVTMVNIPCTDSSGNSTNRLGYLFEYMKLGMNEDLISRFFTGSNGTLTNDPELQGLFIESTRNYGRNILGLSYE